MTALFDTFCLSQFKILTTTNRNMNTIWSLFIDTLAIEWKCIFPFIVSALMSTLSPLIPTPPPLRPPTLNCPSSLICICMIPSGTCPILSSGNSMRKTTKVEFLHKLKENGPGVKLLPKHVVSSTIYIRNAMAVLQMMPGDKHASFQHLANVYMNTLLHCFRDANTVVDVFDR